MDTASKPVPNTVTVPETKAPETAPAAVPQQDERMAQLAKKEQAIRNEVKKFQQEKKAWEEQLKAATIPRTESFNPQEFKKKFLQDPNSVGISYEDIQNTFLNQPSKEQQLIQQLESKIAELEGRQKKSFEDIEASQKRAYEQAVKQVSREVSLLIDNNDAYELIRAAPEGQDAVVKLIESTYSEEGILLSAAEAAKQVEEHLEQEALRLARLKKVQQKLNPPTAEDKKPMEQQPPQKQQASATPTLTNAMSASSSKLTEKERRERAMLAFQGKLK